MLADSTISGKVEINIRGEKRPTNAYPITMEAIKSSKPNTTEGPTRTKAKNNAMIELMMIALFSSQSGKY